MLKNLPLLDEMISGQILVCYEVRKSHFSELDSNTSLHAHTVLTVAVSNT